MDTTFALPCSDSVVIIAARKAWDGSTLICRSDRSNQISSEETGWQLTRWEAREISNYDSDVCYTNRAHLNEFAFNLHIYQRSITEGDWHAPSSGWSTFKSELGALNFDVSSGPSLDDQANHQCLAPTHGSVRYLCFYRACYGEGRRCFVSGILIGPSTRYAQTRNARNKSLYCAIQSSTYDQEVLVRQCSINSEKLVF